MAEYLTPGVYVEETSFRAPSIEGVGTSTTGFVGLALTGPAIRQGQPAPKPELLTSFGDFQNIFGGYNQLTLTNNPTDPTNMNYLAMAVKAFFDNGAPSFTSRGYLRRKGIAESRAADYLIQVRRVFFRNLRGARELPTE